MFHFFWMSLPACMWLSGGIFTRVGVLRMCGLSFLDRGRMAPCLRRLCCMRGWIWRGRGHGLELIRAGIELAAGAGEKRLHVFTESAECLFERFGFEMLDRTLQQAVPISVLARTLP